MSDRLARQIWTSALSVKLKPLAVLLANFADDDGGRIFPSVSYLMWLLESDRRTVQRKLAELRELGVLQVTRGGSGGRGELTHYRLIAASLPVRPVPWREVRNGGTGAALYGETKGRQSEPERAAPRSVKGGTAIPKGRHPRRPDQLALDQLAERSAPNASALPPRKRNQPSPWAADRDPTGGEVYRHPNRILDAIQTVDRAMLVDALSFDDAIARVRSRAEFAARSPRDDFFETVLSYFSNKRGLRISEATAKTA